MKDFLKRIGITKEGEEDSASMTYKVYLDDSTEYGKVFSLLDKSNLVNEQSTDTMDFDKTVFEGEYYTVTLYSDYENDEYSIEVSKTEEDAII